jgi:SAM-dependent methyltransferase
LEEIAVIRTASGNIIPPVTDTTAVRRANAAGVADNCFSKQGIGYLAARPTWPNELFTYLAELCPNRKRAWDCATGNGQVAIKLSTHFKEVFATDISADMIKLGVQRKNVIYKVGAAEKCQLPSKSVNLITGGHAAQWIDLDRFYDEVRRVAIPGAVLSLFGFRDVLVSADVDKIVSRYIHELLGPFWQEKNKDLNDSKLTNLHFPFQEIAHPEFAIRLSCLPERLLTLLDSYSAAQGFLEYHRQLPSDFIREELIEAWGGPNRLRKIQLPVHLRVGRV